MRKGGEQMTRKEFSDKRKELLVDLVEFLREKELDYGQALIMLKDAQSYVERASLKNRI